MVVVDWLIANWVETTAAILGLVGIGLQIKQNHWYWLSSILMVLMYIYVFYTTKFYADMAFQLYYLVVSIYGWAFWIKSRRKQDDTNLEVNKQNKKQATASIAITAILFVAIYLILKHLTDSPIPIGDAFTTALSITATLLLARKYIENWIFWIIVDAVSAGLYLYKGLYPTLILFSVLTILAVVGYAHWRKALKNETSKK